MKKFAYDAYRRFIKMFGDVVLKVPYGKFSRHERQLSQTNQNLTSVQKTARMLVAKFKEVLENEKATLPYEPKEQLKLAINAVFDSFNNPQSQIPSKEARELMTTQEQL